MIVERNGQSRPRDRRLSKLSFIPPLRPLSSSLGERAVLPFGPPPQILFKKRHDEKHRGAGGEELVSSARREFH